MASTTNVKEEITTRNALKNVKEDVDVVKEPENQQVCGEMPEPVSKACKYPFELLGNEIREILSGSDSIEIEMAQEEEPEECVAIKRPKGRRLKQPKYSYRERTENTSYKIRGRHKAARRERKVTAEDIEDVVDEEEISEVEPEITMEVYEDESDGLEDLFAAMETKKKKRAPKRKRQLSKAEIEAKEREQLKKRTCEICNLVFSIPKGLQNHMRVKHTFETPYTCELCGEKFSVQSTYALHRRRHLGIKPHLCNICGKNFLRNTDLRIHMRTHDKTRDIKCDLCPNMYNSVLSLKKHKLIIHTDPNLWKHQCQICGKKCVSTTTLQVHVKQHNEDRSFKCPVCEKGFYTNQNMKVHLRTHSKDTKFNCELCVNGYRSNEALQRHLLKVHSIGREKPVSAPKHFCPICSEGFLQKARLERHVQMHVSGEDEYPFSCDLCRKRYKDKNFFSLHMKKKHSVEADEEYLKNRAKVADDGGGHCYKIVAGESSEEDAKSEVDSRSDNELDSSLS